MSNKECNPQDLSACQKCNPIKMFYKGCCDGDVARANGMESKNIRLKVNGEVDIYDSCKHLEFVELDEPVEIPDRNNPGKTKTVEKVWECTNYFERPATCRNFDCNDTINEHIRGR